MLINAVLLFAALSALFEFAIVMKLKPRTRLRILGNDNKVRLIHLIVFVINISIHYGTVVGSMTAIVAALASFITIPLARWVSGYIQSYRSGNGKLEHYKPGLIHYNYDQIK